MLNLFSSIFNSSKKSTGVGYCDITETGGCFGCDSGCEYTCSTMCADICTENVIGGGSGGGVNCYSGCQGNCFNAEYIIFG